MALKGTLDHPKTIALADMLDIDPCFALGILEAVWHFTDQYAPEGDIGRFTNRAISLGIRTTLKPDKLIAALVEAKFLDEDETYRLIVHDWHDRAPGSTQAKVKARGKGFVKGNDPRRNPGGKPQEAQEVVQTPVQTPDNPVQNTVQTSVQQHKKSCVKTPLTRDPESGVQSPETRDQSPETREFVEITTGESPPIAEPSIGELAKNRLDELAGKLTGEKPDKPIGRAPLPPPSDLNSNGRTVEEIARIREEIASRKSVRDPAEEAVHG